jgi:hypothetical protein
LRIHFISEAGIRGFYLISLFGLKMNQGVKKTGKEGRSGWMRGSRFSILLYRIL